MFVVGLKSKLKTFVQCYKREAFTPLSWITYFDSEYGLLLPIQITDSYLLNVTGKQSSHHSVVCEGWDGLMAVDCKRCVDTIIVDEKRGKQQKRM